MQQTFVKQHPPVLSRGCQLTQADLYNGWNTGTNTSGDYFPQSWFGRTAHPEWFEAHILQDKLTELKLLCPDLTRK